MDIASLGFRVDSSGVAKADADLDRLVDAAGRAADAEADLAAASTDASAAVAEVGDAASGAAAGVSALAATTKALAEADQVAQQRIREMVRASLEKRQAMLATEAATRKAADATRELTQSEGGSRGGDALAASYAEAQQELVSFGEALQHQAQSMDDIGERREWLTDLNRRGLVSEKDYSNQLKIIEQQERTLNREIDARATQAQRLLRTYDPASLAIQKLTQDERALNQALRSGSITAEQHAKAMRGLTVNRAKWIAESEGIKQTAAQLDRLAFSSSAAMRDYGVFISALSRGDYQLASNQVLQLGVRAGGLKVAMAALASPLTIVAALVTAVAVGMHKAQSETYELQRSVVLSGHAAGVTAGQLREMAVELDAIGSTRTGALSVLTQLAASGRVAAENLKPLTQTVEALKRAGVPIEESVKNFTDLGKEPVEASLRLNEQMNYLNREVLEQIELLQQRGEIEAAGALAQKTYGDAALENAREVVAYLPTLVKAYRSAAKGIKEAGSSFVGLFQVDTPEERLNELRDSRGNRELFTGRNWGKQFAQDSEEGALARQIAERGRRIDEAVAAAREVRERRETQARITREQQIEKQVGDARSQARSSSVQRELNNSVAQFAAYESQLEALREAGLINDEDYYSEKRKLIEQHRDTQIEALQLEAKRLEAESARIRAAAGAESANASPEERARIEATAQVAVIANLSKIAELEAQIAILRGKAIADLNVVATQQEAANRSIELSYKQAQAAAETYLQTLERQQQRQLDAFGQGGRARERAGSRNNIDERFTDQRLQAESDFNQGPQSDEARRKYEKRLEVIEDTNRRAIESDSRYWMQREAMESSFYVGAGEAMANYAESARNVAMQSEELFTNAFKSMEDALVGFVMTGKLDFASLADAIIADLLRIQIRALAMQAISSGGDWLGALFGAFAGATASTGAAGSLTSTGPAMTVATGINYVPRDNQLAILHKGEAVVPAKYNPWAGGKSMSGANVTINSPISVAPGTSVAQVDAIVQHRNAELEVKIIEGLKRGRYGVTS